MANNDKLWIDLGVRDNVSQSLIDLMRKTEQLARKMANVGTLGPGLKNIHDLGTAYDRIGESIRKLKDASARTSDAREKARINDIINGLKKMENQFKALESMEDLLGEKGTVALQKLYLGLDLATKGAERYTRSVDIVQTKMTQLASLRAALLEGISKGNSLGIDTSAAKSMLGSLWSSEMALQRTGRLPSNAQGKAYDDMVTKAKELARVLGVDVARAENVASMAAQGMVSSFDKVVNAGNRANSMMQQLGMQIASYFSIYGIEHLLKSVIEIGGQFEIQHMALKSIIGDVQQANYLFEQMKELAVVSPFNFSQLVSYAKQMTAFGIPYEELYDSTKRLADMSAGLGVDMSRLILAYGQVRSAAVLRGQELRQFTEAGIPLVRALADEFTKLNGETTTTGEVFELISKRAVPFEMVKKVLWDMTDEGGRFYNMQFTLADTLAGKWSNLVDAWQIMLSNFSKGGSFGGKILKGLVEEVTNLIQALDTLAPAIGGVVAAYSFGKGLKMFGGMFSTSVFEDQIRKAQKLNELKLREKFIQGEINAQELRRTLETNKNLNLWRQQLALSGRMSKAQLLRLNYKKQENKELLKQLVLTNVIDKNTASMLEAGKRMSAGFRMAGSAIKGAIGSMGGILLAVEAVAAIGTSMYLNWQRTKDAMKEASDTFMNTARDRSRDLETEISGNKKNAPTTEEGYRGAIDAMKDQLKQYDVNYASIMREADGLDTLKEKYDLLSEELVYVKEAYDMANNSKAAFNDLQGDTKNLKNEADKWTESTKQMDMAITQLAANGSKNVEEVIKRIANDIPAMKEAIFGDDGVFVGAQKALKWMADNLSQQEMSDIYRVLEGKWRQFDKSGREVIDYHSEWGQLDKDDAEMFEKFYQNYVSRTSRFNYEIRPMLEKAYTSAIDQTAAQLGIKSDELIKQLEKNGEKTDQRTRALLNNYFDQQMKAIAAGNEEFSRWVDSQVTPLYFHYKIFTDYKSEEKPLQGAAAKAWNMIGGNAMPGVKKGGLTEKDLKDAFGESGNDYTNAKGFLKKKDDEAKEAYESVKRFNEKGVATEKEVKNAKEHWDNVHRDVNSIMSPDKSSGGGGSKGGGTRKDTLLENAKTQLEEVKGFLSEYKKYVKVYGEAKSIQILEALFPTIGAGEGKRIVDDYKGVLDDILKKVPQDTNERKKFGLSIAKLISEADLDEVQRNLDEALRYMEAYIKETTSSWNLYKNLLGKTGDKDFAMQAFVNGVQWDDVSRSMADKLWEGLDDTFKKYDVSSLFDMDDESAKKMFAEHTDQYKLWQEISKTIHDNWKKGLEDVADATEKLMTAEEKMLRVEQQMADMRKQGIGANDPRMILKEQEKNKIATEIFENSEPYLQFYSGIFAMTVDQAEKVGMSIKENLVEQLARGEINADKYLKSIKNVDQQLQKMRSRRGDAMTLLTGGYKGLLEKRRDTAESQVSAAAISVQKAEEELDKIRRESVNAVTEEEKRNAHLRIVAAETELNIRKKQLAELQKVFQWSEDSLKNAEDMLAIANIITDIFGGLEQGARQLSEMFDAMGNEGAAWAFEDMADSLNAIVSPLNEATAALKSAMGGDVGGVISHAVGILTAPITAFSKNHDKKNERQIQKSIARVKELTTAYENLEKAIESSLGGIYTTGGYTEMYENLRKQRAELQLQYDKEDDKKKKDKDKLADYKQQLQEMDEAVKDFALNMAKTIYDIDVKSWANELGDALFDAWKKGEDGAKAFRDKAKDLIRDLTKNILIQKVIETAFKPLEKIIEDEMNRTEGRLDEQSISAVATFVGGLAETLPLAANALLDGVDKELQNRGLGSIKDEAEEEASSTTNSIKSITEETANLLASYINAIRADVSVNRVTLTEILLLMQAQAETPTIAKAQLVQLEMITTNTQRNADAAELIYNLLHANVAGANTFKVN